MGIKRTKLIHMREDCIGCNSCGQILPERFCMNVEDGKADMRLGKQKGEYFVAEIDDMEKEKVEECAEACPMGIIRVAK